MEIIVDNQARISGASPATIEKIKSALTVLNPQYLEAVRFNRWLGGIPKQLKFFKIEGSEIIIPRGYLAMFIEELRLQQIKPIIKDNTRALPEIFFENYALTLKDYQQTAVDIIEKTRFGTLSAPTGSGKTVMAIALIARRKQPSIILVHTRELLEQWKDRVEAFLGIPKKEIGVIGGGKRKIGFRVTVALVQSVYKIADEIKHNFGHLIIDECHRAPSRIFTDAVKAFDCRYVLGLSATPYRRDKLTNLIFWFIGPFRHQIPEQELKAAGHVMEANIVIRHTNFASMADLTTEYTQVITDLTEDKDRNQLIIDDVIGTVKTSPGIALLLSDRIPHCELLAEGFQKYPEYFDSVAILTGGIKKKTRQQIVEKLNSGQIKILIATGQLIGEGFDCKGLSSLFLCTPIKFSGRLIQYLGRILRPDIGKLRATIFDYFDDQLWASARERFRIYQKK